MNNHPPVQPENSGSTTAAGSLPASATGYLQVIRTDEARS
jgi:hypothetical protein